MFLQTENQQFQYLPILSVKPSEMDALSQLPDKSKDQILPLIPLRAWMSSKSLKNTFKVIDKSFGDRKVILDIDCDFLTVYEDKLDDENTREVFRELATLCNPNGGYENWYQHLAGNENYIPTVQLDDLSQLETQLNLLASLNRGLVFRFKAEDLDWLDHVEILTRIARVGCGDILVIYDYGQVTREILNYIEAIHALINVTDNILGNPLISIACTSFPSSFSGCSEADFSIVERLLFNKIKSALPNSRLIYSDWGSARAEKIEGGSRVPPPRIDYPLKNEWIVFRTDFEDPKNIIDGEKETLYKDLAIRLISSKYWNPNLSVWGTQLIGLTSLGDSFGITNAQKSTAARINIHLYQQLHYETPIESIDDDEIWVD